jgi:hypothetical protein
VIDNTSVIVADGTGADAVIAPEMVTFARTLGFQFQAHAVGHADRKGRIERPFFYLIRLSTTKDLPPHLVDALSLALILIALGFAAGILLWGFSKIRR